MMTMGKHEMHKPNPDFDLGLQILQAVKGIRFGSVEIIIHDGKVVQIERKEKLRFENRATLNTKS
ncbi:hypothetical protein MGMO_144c00140 [Methyloglobulus morosus KoM1]|uniref:DUF2292 domain-containing protein n=2 Tax=Methyloglobulus TaxID=1410680 RepID=V5BVZ0_9GAMM|nr:hypothetical protein MGMO_144c00140 [Methyloglobulus morosus KoM1]